MNPKRNNGILPFMLVNFGIGIFSGLLLIFLTPDAFFENLLFPELIFLLMLLADYLIHPFLHEVGHLICGKISGYNLISFRIGHIMIYRNKTGLHCCFQNKTTAGVIGQCLMCPPESRELRYPVRLYHLGGVIANLVIVVISMALYFLLPAYPVWQTFALTTFAFGLYLVLVNGIPYNSEYIQNDVCNIILIEKEPAVKKAIDTNLRVMRVITEGGRLRNLPMWVFDLPDEKALVYPKVITQLYYRAEYLIDIGKYQDAVDVYTFLLTLDHAGTVYKAIANSTLVFLELVVGNCDLSYVTRHFSRETEGYLRQTANRSIASARILYAYELLAQHNLQAAKFYWCLFERLRQKGIYEGMLEEETELMALAQQRGKTTDQDLHNPQE